jgi:hypothetical protein
MPEPSPEVNYDALGLLVQPRAHGETARFKIVTDKSIVNMIMLQFDKRIAINPSLQSARAWVTPEVMQCVKDDTLTPPAFHALMTALATENIPTTLPAESISQDTAFGAVGGKGFQGKGSGGKGGGGGNIKTGGTSGGAGGGGGIKTGGTGSGAGVGGGSKTSSGSGGGYGGGSGGAAASAPRSRAPDKAATTSRQSSLVPGDSTGVICYARFVALLGPKMENLTACAGLINKYCTSRTRLSTTPSYPIMAPFLFP